jgi:hypothetical protein
MAEEATVTAGQLLAESPRMSTLAAFARTLVLPQNIRFASCWSAPSLPP